MFAQSEHEQTPSHNLLAITGANPRKAQNMAHSLGVENGDSAAFILFIEGLIVSKWFEVGDILIMDNAAIHAGGEAAIVENLLWECQVNGTPLRVLIVCLPTRSPKLNPVELLFHVLARRIQSWQHRLAEQGPNAVVEQASRVLGEMSYELIISCYVHCGY
jgi:transposase